MFDPDALMTQAVHGRLPLPDTASTPTSAVTQPTPTNGRSATSPASQPAPQQGFSPVIDVGGSAGAPMGQPGSQFAPSLVSPSGARAVPHVMPAPVQSPAPAQAAAAGQSSFDPDALMTQAVHGRLPAPAPVREAPNDPGALANAGAGANEALTSTLGAPVDLVTGALNAGIRGINDLAGSAIPQIQHPIGGSASLDSALGLLGADPRAVAAPTQADRLARAAGSGAAGMLMPMGAARALPELAGIPGAIQTAFGSGTPAVMAASGALGGAGSQLAQDAVPAPWKPIAGTVGGVVAGGLPIAGEAMLRGGARLAGLAADKYIAPLTQSGRARLAGQTIARAASDANAVRDALDAANVPNESQWRAPIPGETLPSNAQTRVDPETGEQQVFVPGEMVPGSRPTTYQLTGDAGLGTLERVAAKNNPAAFNERRAEQNIAQVRAIGRAAPEGADPSAVGRLFRDQLSAIDADGEAAIERARAAAQQANDRLGGAPAFGDQQSALQGYGERLRGGLDALNQQHKAAVGLLYDQIDPDGALAVDTSHIRATATQLAKEWPANAAVPSGDADAVLGTARMQKSVQPFREIGALRSRVLQDMRDERVAHGQSPTYRLLTRLAGAIDDTLSGAVESKAAAEHAAVAAGKMSPSDTAAARILLWIRNWRNGDQAGTEGAQGLGDGASGYSAGGPRELFGVHGARDTRVDATRRADPRGSSGLAPEQAALDANWDQDAAARYRAANAAHRERVTTYEKAPGVGEVLRTGANAGEWKLGDSRVAGALFRAGPGAAERVQAFLKAGGNSEALVSDLKDYAAFDLRRHVADEDGTLNPAKFKRWMAAHSEALSAFPDLAAEFQNAADARVAMDDATGQHMQARRAFERSAASHFLGDRDPVQTIGRILRSSDGAAVTRDLVAKIGDDDAAKNGLRRGAVNFILEYLRGNALAGTNAERAFKVDAFQTFMRRSEPALRELFDTPTVDSMRAVADDMQRAQQSYVATKLPGGSNTAQDIAAGKAHGHGQSLMSSLVGLEAAGEALQGVAEHLPIPGAGAFGKVFGIFGARAFQEMHAAGLKSIDDLVAEAMLHPELARALLAKVPPGRMGYPVLRNAVRQIGALSANAAVRATAEPNGR